MAGKSKLPALAFTSEEEKRLETLQASRAAPVREVERARILLQYHAGNNPSAIQRSLGISRVTIYHCLHKALAMGIEAALKDAFHRPKEPVITSADKAWVVHLACTKPKELGYAAELWTRQSLALHVRQQAQAAGHPSLARAAKATVQRILEEQHLQPHKVKYYLERRDPEFELKMKEVLMVYQEVAVQNQAAAATPAAVAPSVITVSIDEKPGVQALELCSHAQARLLGQSGGNALWQDGAYLPEANPGQIQSRTQRKNSARDRGDQCCSRGASLEKVRSFGWIMCKPFNETLY